MDVESLKAWHNRERVAWLTTRSSSDPEYCETMAEFHASAIALLSAARDEGRAEGLGGECAATGQTGWLVEHYASKRGEYLAEWLTGWPAFDDSARETWTKDSAQALRFARREDAEQVIQALGWTEARATEHVWGAPPASQTQEG